MTKRAGTAPELRLVMDKLDADDGCERDLAWRALADAHYERVYRLVARFGVESAEVEDLVQRSFVIAFQRIGEVEKIRDPGAWLRGIAVHVVSQHRRWRGVRSAKRWLLRSEPIGIAPVVTPENSTAAAQEVAAVRRVMAKLPHKLREALVLCDIEELKPGEAARILHISVNTVRSRRRIAKEKFLVLWQEQEGESV